jgi:hypothetical protein
MRTFTGLSQYSVFKVQAAADFPFVLRFCPLHAACVVFGGKEVHYAFALTVSTTSRNFLPTTFWPVFQGPIGENNNASRSFRKAFARQHVNRVARLL